MTDDPTKAKTKAYLKSWMTRMARIAFTKGCLEGKGYHPSDICYLFRHHFGIRMNEKFVIKCLGKEMNPSGR